VAVQLHPLFAFVPVDFGLTALLDGTHALVVLLGDWF
jgi:hypothetical protein